MYQLHHRFTDDQSFRSFVQAVANDMAQKGASGVLFHFFNDTAVRSVTDNAIAILQSVMPEAPYVGCSTSGNISGGEYVNGTLPNLTVIADVFEDPATQVEVHQFPLDEAHRKDTASKFLQLVGERPWVKAVEIISTFIDVSMFDFCSDISNMRDDIALFGGAALSSEIVDMFSGLPYIFSSAGENSGHVIALVLYGGENFHAFVQTISGWKPLGMPLSITRAEGPVIYELDGVSAFDRYHHYLSIENDESFAERSLLFPFVIEHDDAMVVKAPLRVGEDGSITLTSDVPKGEESCRIAYGDPATILRSIKESANALCEFRPEAIFAFSCAARFMYWGPEYVSCETEPFSGIAPTAGFYTGGEFARHGHRVVHHNVTLVVAGMREGDAREGDLPDIAVGNAQFNRQMAIVNSLAVFVGVTAVELQDAYEVMERLAKVDGLTGVFNRREIEGRLESAIDAFNRDRPALNVLMFDLDDFKQVNDRFGHEAGDDVLRKLGRIFTDLVDDKGIGVSGRWGGEEFMVVIPGASVDQALDLAQRLSSEFSSIDFSPSGRCTMSCGVAQAQPGETLDSLCSRADNALYAAKGQGKNCVVVG